ncbi:MAG TPA: HNH endonuclease [Bacteroidota bacterium]|nr:HNH endonuclease [Bacteroidota bacterium]
MPTRKQRARKLGVPIDRIPDGRGKGRKISGLDHYRWNAGKMYSSHGYVKVRVGVGHPLADSNGYAYEHHVVWWNSGRQLPGKEEVIHHKNEDKTDNRLSNLELLTRREHCGEHCAMLSDAAVREIRIRYAAGEDGTALAKEYGIPFSRAYRFIKGETRKGAGGPIQSGSLRFNAKRNRAGRLLDGRECNEFPEMK